jgi:hypothetical protein
MRITIALIIATLIVLKITSNNLTSDLSQQSRYLAECNTKYNSCEFKPLSSDY